MEINRIRGECRDTVYRLEPFQDYPKCDNRPAVVTGIFTIPFINPLPGAAKEVTVQLDEDAPNVTCGFFPDANSINVVDDRTLYHYMLKKDGYDAQKEDARFFYNVTVSTSD